MSREEENPLTLTRHFHHVAEQIAMFQFILCTIQEFVADVRIRRLLVPFIDGFEVAVHLFAHTFAVLPSGGVFVLLLRSIAARRGVARSGSDRFEQVVSNNIKEITSDQNANAFFDHFVGTLIGPCVRRGHGQLIPHRCQPLLDVRKENIEKTEK